MSNRLVGFGQCSLRVIVPTTPPAPAGLAEDEPLPAANNTHDVSTRQQLIDAVSAASNGDHIVLANRSYGGAT